jgi:hypothetical protein
MLTLPVIVCRVPTIAAFAATLNVVPLIAVLVAVELPVIVIADTDEFERNTWLAAVTERLAVDVTDEPVIPTFAAMLKSVPPTAVFVAVELPAIAIAVTDEFDLNTWLAAVDSTLDVDVS